MTCSWGGTNIPAPAGDGITISDDFVGEQYLVASGAMVSDSIATKRTIALQWRGITTSEKDTLYTKATTLASTALILPINDASSGYETYTVTPLRNTWQATSYGITPSWDCQCTVRET